MGDLGGGVIAVLAGCSTGAISRLRMAMPTAPGADPASIQLKPADFDGSALAPWLVSHEAAVTGLDVNSGKWLMMNGQR